MELITELNRDVPGIECDFTTVEWQIPQVELPISFWRTPEPLRRLCVVTRSAGSSSQFHPCGNACPKPTNRRKNPANRQFSFSSFIYYFKSCRRIVIFFDLFNNVFQLHNGNTHKAVISSKAIVLDTDVKFEGFQSFLVADGTMRQNNITFATRSINHFNISKWNLQVKCLVVLWWPGVGLWLCCEFSLLVSQMRTDQIGFDKRAENSLLN